MITIACVLKSGGDFDAEDVRELRDQVADNLKRPHTFICLSDVEIEGVQTVVLRHGWPGWWSKIELFRPDIFDGPVLYFDLDTWIVGSLDPIVDALPAWGMLSDFYRPDRVASGVMSFRPNVLTYAVYADFVRGAAVIIRSQSGDQDFLQFAGTSAVRFQDAFPGRFVSWKEHCAKTRDAAKARTGTIPEGAAVVCFHGKPRPWEVEL